MIGFVVVFTIGVPLWCAIGWFLVTRPMATKGVLPLGQGLLPAVLIAIGVVILIDGDAFGL